MLSSSESNRPNELTTERKALTINLDTEIYGTFAEIGAGQEVARHFFKAGGAAGTIAKSMSAYDMKFSDEIYGRTTRYVSRDRLIQMLDHEFSLLVDRLASERGSNTCFFVFADTVTTSGFNKDRDAHGWMGIRFQLRPGDPPTDIIMHIRMLDKASIAQQEALGILGVNFIYATFLMRDDIEAFIQSLPDNVGTARIEVDRLEFSGHGMGEVDNRIVNLQLVRYGLTNAVIFGRDGSIQLASELLYKKSVLVERGSFRPITHVNIDMLRCASAQFMQEPETGGRECVTMLEITMNNLLAEGEIDYADFIARIDTISAAGYPVLISNYMEFYRLSAYFRRNTQHMIGIVLGVNLLLEVFKDSYYQNLDGGILEALGRLFKDKVKLYVYPMSAECFNRFLNLSPSVNASQAPDDVLITARNVQVEQHLRNLYAYLLENRFIDSIVGFNESHLHIFSKDVLPMIRAGDSVWENFVPAEVAVKIKANPWWTGQKQG